MKAKITRLSGIIELEGSVADVAAAIKALEMPVVSVPSVFGPAVVTDPGYSWAPANPQVPCQHQWPDLWMSTSPPSCLKCGMRAAYSAPTVTISAIS